MLGLMAAGLKTHVVPVQVFSNQINGQQTVKQQIIALFAEAAAFLHQLTPSFPELALNETDFKLLVNSAHRADANLKEAPSGYRDSNKWKI